MMEWKTFLMQSAVTFIAVFLGIKLFSPTLPEVTEVKTPSPEALLEPLHALEVRLDKIANMLAKQPPPRDSVSDRDAASINIDEINRNLRTITATLARLETKEPPAPSAGTPTALGGMPFQSPSIVNPVDWMQGLPENKRAQVNEIFREQTNILKEKMAAVSSGGKPPPPEVFHTYMEENTQELKNKLQPILSEEEYRSFLASYPPHHHRRDRRRGVGFRRGRWWTEGVQVLMRKEGVKKSNRKEI